MFQFCHTGTRSILPVKKGMRTCEISFAALGTLFLCCVNVVNQNTVALLLLVFCYSYATWHVLVTHLTTYTQHENREAKEKRQDRRILQNRTYGQTVSLILYNFKTGLIYPKLITCLAMKKLLKNLHYSDHTWTSLRAIGICTPLPRPRRARKSVWLAIFQCPAILKKLKAFFIIFVKK